MINIIIHNSLCYCLDFNNEDNQLSKSI